MFQKPSGICAAKRLSYNDSKTVLECSEKNCFGNTPTTLEELGKGAMVVGVRRRCTSRGGAIYSLAVYLM